jgi:hypothetical protein
MIHQHDNRPTALTVDQRMVAIVNAVTVSHARRFICSLTKDFVCALPDRRLAARGASLGSGTEKIV